MGVQGQVLNKLEAGLDFTMRFDNREYHSDYSESKTLFSYKLTPHMGFRFEDKHRLTMGFDMTRNFGALGPDQRDAEFMIYYDYDGERFDVFAGVFPRDKMTVFPREFFAGSGYFYDAVMEGLLLRYGGKCGYLELAGDWHGMKTVTQRERFVIYSSGQWNPIEEVRLGYYASVHHFSESEIEQGVVDNVLLKPYAGFAKGPVAIGVAWVQALQRDRLIDDEFRTPGGFWADLDVKWRSLGLVEGLYLGDDLMPYWGSYGPGLYLGDPFFRTEHGVYNRLEAYWAPKIGRAVSLKISSVHHYDGASWNWQQLATLAINLNRDTIGKKKK